jgi:hypothetical protein
LVSLLTLGIALRTRDSDAPRALTGGNEAKAGVETATSLPHERAERVERPLPSERRAPVDRIAIDGVDVDKAEVCRGEQVVVTVRARSLDGTPEFLNYGVIAHPDIAGSRFTLTLQESLGLDWMKVFVRGKYGTSEVASVPPVLVKDCAAPFVASIGVRRRSAEFDRVWLTASVVAQGGEAAQGFEPVEYEWDFGDGTVEKVATPEVEHSYEGRPQLGTHSYFFVTLKARDASGRVVRTSESVRFVNLGFWPLAHEDRVVVFSSIRQGSGDSETIRLYHGAPFDVTLDRVTVEEVRIDAGGEEHSVGSVDHNAASLLGVSALPAGKSVEVRDLSHLRPADANTLTVVRIAGRAHGKVVSGSLTLMPRTPAVAQQ